MTHDEDPIITTPLFWDCNCEDEFIRSAEEDQCYACGATRENSPDSRIEEVILFHIEWKLDEDLYQQVLKSVDSIPY